MCWKRFLGKADINFTLNKIWQADLNKLFYEDTFDDEREYEQALPSSLTLLRLILFAAFSLDITFIFFDICCFIGS